MKILSQLIYEETISKLLKKAKCSGPEDCFLTFHVDGHSESITTWYPLTNFKEAIGLKKPNLQVQHKCSFFIKYDLEFLMLCLDKVQTIPYCFDTFNYPYYIHLDNMIYNVRKYGINMN